jgi:hypothetical protein
MASRLWQVKYKPRLWQRPSRAKRFFPVREELNRLLEEQSRLVTISTSANESHQHGTASKQALYPFHISMIAKFMD